MKQLVQKVAYLEQILADLEGKSIEQKIELLLQTKPVEKFSKQIFLDWLSNFSLEEQYLFLCVVLLDQGPNLLSDLNANPSALVEVLEQMERFYATIGGIIGYHLTVLHILSKKKEEIKQTYLQPVKMDLRTPDEEVKKAIRAGIENLPRMAELYPVGGAGDRLALMCPEENEPLPAAQLPFCGITLLEGLFRDLHAREYLFFKLTGKQTITPVGLMTSQEKDNHARILKILEEKNYFGRPAASIRLFKQPMVPVLTEEGDWVAKGPMDPFLKPGGHGVIWRLAIADGIFDWLEGQKRDKGLVRQINNPIAGIDYGLLAFTGIGLMQNKAFGFASCPRLVHSAEGTDVLIENQNTKGYVYTLSNVEYTEFSKKSIADRPVQKGGKYSAFPANTNILFFDLQHIRRAVAINPIPGMILNMKNKVVHNGKTLAAGRLESTMQNISDFITCTFTKKPTDAELLQMPVYLTYNHRRKTLSVAKNAYDENTTVIGTPQGCFYEWLENAVELLEKECGMQLPAMIDLNAYLEKGPHINVHYHPALGPLFQIIAQKIRGGSMSLGSELVLHISELLLQNVQIEGSLFIHANSIEVGRCKLINCTITNAGIDTTKPNEHWKQEIYRKEMLEIHLTGNAEFYAEDVHFSGNHSIQVPDGFRMIATQQNGKVYLQKEPINKSTWKWNYSFDADHNVVLKIDS